MKRAVSWLVVLALAGWGAWWLLRPGPTAVVETASSSERPLHASALSGDASPTRPGWAAGNGSAPPPAATLGVADAASIIPTGRSEVADRLNAPGGSIRDDLKVLSEVFDAWLSNFRSEGNPIGDNRFITAALMGDNRLKIVLIELGHPAVSTRGELCDRWGTPFRFHVLSRTQMEIRSAGPDRQFGTDDDAEWAPWPKNF